ncbi:MAG: (2Fe-2S)-binding protein [Pseudomonadales bacterium]|nr:(2Fe-2S)-binding protein [Pseudomonadales bacterium]
MIEFTLNGNPVTIDVEPDTPLLWVIRENLGLNGTKFGCGMSLCGACTIHLDGEPIRACSTPVSEAANRQLMTIEGLGEGGVHPVQQAWIETNVPQCGYCQSGQIMAAVALLDKKPMPSDADIDAAMSGNICRCGMYGRIRDAVHRAAELNAATGSQVVQMFDPDDPLVREFTERSTS